MHDMPTYDAPIRDTYRDNDNEKFLDKWRGRWPEWRIAQIFVDPAHSAQAEAWFALLQEFTDAAWNGTDPTPGIAKLGWWQEELRGWAKGARRHPLGIALHKSPAPWPALAASLTALHMAREGVLAGDPATVELLVETLRPCTDAMDACERVLFQNDGRGDGRDATGSDVRASAIVDPKAGLMLIAIHTLWASADEPGSARHTSFARTLRAVWTQPASTRCRRIYEALIRKRLQPIAIGAAFAPVSPWSALWIAWRAARR
jgi:hypothetical protein